MSGPSEFVSIADREIAARKRRDEAQAILDSLPAVSTGKPDCDGLSFEEVKARIADHSLPRPTLPQLDTYMRERQRQLNAKPAGGILVSRLVRDVIRPDRTEPDAPSGALVDHKGASVA